MQAPLEVSRATLPARYRPSRLPGGFTLVEMMTVVAVIGILSALALPRYTSYRDRVRTDQARKDIVMMAVTITHYWTDARSYPASLADVGLSGRLDPWGNAYCYLPLAGTHNQGHARKDHSLVPINTDFDLYSMGPDGRSAPPLTARDSRDDIVRANDGQFVGVASSY
jgi:general secretion pathway protein G